MLKEEFEDKTQNRYTAANEEQFLEAVKSTPFQVEFEHTVCKVACGDRFSVLLTCDGSVYTWGSNMFG